MEFQVNDVAVYPGKGVGRVSEIKDKEVDGKIYRVYVLDFPADIEDPSEITSTLEVPIKRISNLKMRAIMHSDRIEDVYHILKDRNVPPNTQTWNRRYREYLTKIATGDPQEISQVLRDLALLKARKNLSFGERKMYDQAHSLIIEEAAHSLFNTERPGEEKTIAALDILKERVSGEIAEIFRPDEEAAKLEAEAKLSSKKAAASSKKAAEKT